MERSARQATLAELWTIDGHAALLELLARSEDARDHELIHELHAQAQQCRDTAPQATVRLELVAGQLAEIHAGLRAAESIESLAQLLAWQAEAAWRRSGALHRLLAMVAASSSAGAWPWRIERLPGLQVDLDRLLVAAVELAGLPAAVRRERLEALPPTPWPELAAWLGARARAGDERAEEHARLQASVLAWHRIGAPGTSGEHRAQRASDETILGELIDLWHRLDPALDRTCIGLRTEVVAGQRALTEALRAVETGADAPERRVHRRAYLLYHLLDDPGASTRRAALGAFADLIVSAEGRALERFVRGVLVLRYAVALVLHWHVLADPGQVLDSALRLVERSLTQVVDGAAPRLERDLVLVRARLLGVLAWWREDRLEEALRAYDMALGRLTLDPSERRLRGQALGELATLRRGRRTPEVVARDQEIRAGYDEALAGVHDTTLLRARVSTEYAIYLARPLAAAPDDPQHAMALIDRAVSLLDALPEATREHPLVRIERARSRLVRGNVRLEGELLEPEARRAASVADYRRGLEVLGEADDLLAALLHLDLALVALGEASPGRRDESLALARRELDLAEPGLRTLPVAHARALTERATLAVNERPDDEQVRRRAILELEGALHRLPAGSDRVVRARVQRQLGDLYLGRDGVDDLERAASCFADARSAFLEGGSTRLAVEVARDYAESQLRQHADEGDRAALQRGAVVLEQASLLAERRWATRSHGEPTERLVAMLDGVYGDLAWFQAKLERPVEAVLRTVCKAKRYRATPSLRSLRGRAERSAMVSPAYLDPLARRIPPAARPSRTEAEPGELGSAQLTARVQGFARANPDVLALDLTLTRWGTVVLAASREGLAYVTVPLTRETARRWIWGDAASPGWWSRHLAWREAADRGRDGAAAERERAWIEAGTQLAAELGRRLLVPALQALGRDCDDRIVLLAAGRLTGLPFLATRMGERSLLRRVRGFALLRSLADLPPRALPSRAPTRALCLLADPSPVPGDGPVEELGDVVRLLASARADVEVMARHGDAGGSAVYQPRQAKTRERTVVHEEPPTVDAVLARAGTIDHLFYGGQGFARGLVLLDGQGRPARLDGLALRRGPQWSPDGSVFISGTTRVPPPTDDAAVWSLVEALRAAGVGFVVLPTHLVPETFARDYGRSFYLYLALGRSIPEAHCAALVNVAGSDIARVGSFVVAVGQLPDEPPPPREPGA